MEYELKEVKGLAVDRNSTRFTLIYCDVGTLANLVEKYDLGYWDFKEISLEYGIRPQDIKIGWRVYTSNKVGNSITELVIGASVKELRVQGTDNHGYLQDYFPEQFLVEFAKIGVI